MFLLKLIGSMLVQMLVFGALLFLPAGTLRWPAAWAFLALLFVAGIVTMLYLFRDDDTLLDERLKLPLQRGQPAADKVIVLLLVFAFCGAIAFIPIDVFRLHLLPPPSLRVSAFGLGLFFAGWCISALAMRDNRFAVSVVRHQQERGQTVVDTGVYGIVRHPMYAGALPLLVGMALWLGSYAGALVALVPITILVVRIAIEERFLRRELKGYEGYTRKVRYRLIPFVW